MHEHASGLTATPKGVLFCSCKCRKFIGQNKVKILSFQVKEFVALVIMQRRIKPSGWSRIRFPRAGGSQHALGLQANSRNAREAGSKLEAS